MSDAASMLAATCTGGGAFSVERVPVPRLAPDELLLRVRAASICATDVKIIRNVHRKLPDGRKIILGHEFVGVVEEVGPLARGFHTGQRVGVAPNAGCGQCAACARGLANYCPAYTAFGIDRDGGHAAWVRVPAAFLAQGNVIPLPDGVSDVEAALLEPFSCVVNGVRVARIELGDTVAIYGAGPMGLLHAMLCRVAGAGKVIVVDPAEDRLAQALALGCDLALSPRRENVPQRLRQETGGRGADVIITACPVAEVQSEAVTALAPFGRLCLFGGLPKGKPPVPLDTNAIHYGNFLVSGSTGGSVEDYRIALRLVAGKRVDLSRVIWKVFDLDDLGPAYDAAMAGPAGKIVLVAK